MPTTVLCPVDFSDASRGALRYGSIIAAHLRAELAVVTVTDPLLIEAAELSGSLANLPDAIQKELSAFCEKSLSGGTSPSSMSTTVMTGKPAVEILRFAKERDVALVVMSTHGLTGVRKLFFGSTTERVLRETNVPILLTPAHDHGPSKPEDVKQAVKRVLVPVDFGPATAAQMTSAARIAAELDVPLVVAHIVEPVRLAVSSMPALPTLELERRSRGEKALADLIDDVPAAVKAEALVAYGDPAEEVAKVARDRAAGLIVVGLHASTPLGPRMGSVTYRVVCLTSSMVLALPPE
jgi:nucleotide-binding universal stress UspA family protein